MLVFPFRCKNEIGLQFRAPLRIDDLLVDSAPWLVPAERLRMKRQNGFE
jgi:hypothetical protein